MIVKVCAPVVPPPGPRFVTVMESVPAFAISAAARLIVSLVGFTKLVERFTPLTCAIEAFTNPVPFNVKVNPALPAITEAGSIEVSVGTGLLIVKFSALVVAPPGAGFVTVTFALPAVEMSAAEIVAVTCVELTKVVALATPFQFTMVVSLKLVPLTVSAKVAPPAVAEVGAMPVKVGIVLLIVTVVVADVSGKGSTVVSAPTISIPTG